MEYQCELAGCEGSIKIPKHLGDAIQVVVQLPLPENFNDFIEGVHDENFGFKVNNKVFGCVLNQGGTPITLSFPDKETSPTIATIKLQVYCDIEEIITIKKSEKLSLIIN